VTSHAFVAWSLHDKKADTGLPPTVTTFISSQSDMSDGAGEDAYAAAAVVEEKNECGGGELLLGKSWDGGSSVRKLRAMPTLFGLLSPESRTQVALG
jgi:hypothetical protein